MKTNKVKLINQIKSIILKYAKPERIYLYGSVARVDATISSDIDIAYDDVLFDKEYLIDEESSGT